MPFPFNLQAFKECWYAQCILKDSLFYIDAIIWTGVPKFPIHLLAEVVFSIMFKSL